ncbi:MAG: glycosyltransferase [Desulfurococcaceae archaeon]
MKVLSISNEIRPGFSFAASMTLSGHKVLHIHISSFSRSPSSKSAIVELDSGTVGLKFIELPVNFYRSKEFVEKISNIIEEFDVVVSTPLSVLTKFPINKPRKPLVLRFYSAGVFDKVNELKTLRIFFEMPLSYIRINRQALLSTLLVAHSNYVAKFLKERLVLRRPVNFVYPTYAKVFFHNEDHVKNDAIKGILEDASKKRIVLGIAQLWRPGFSRKIDEKVVKILYYIAKENPKVNVVILGSNDYEVKAVLRRDLPQNLISLGLITHDTVIEHVYRLSDLVVVPVRFKSVSMRLLEALFYGKAILTTSATREMFPDLINLYHVYISDDFHSYPYIIDSLFARDLINVLEEGAKKAWKKFFSESAFRIKMDKIVEYAWKLQ